LIEGWVSRSRDGKWKLDELAGAIRSLADSVQAVKLHADEVGQASTEQASAIEEVSQAVARVSELNGQEIASAERSRTIGTQLGAESRGLQEAMAEMEKLMGGAVTPARERQSAAGGGPLSRPAV
jgi:methyl-accepting chemotaxis protein/methyl-accepting chemotaxis protein-1 (serine sensor receptor)